MCIGSHLPGYEGHEFKERICTEDQVIEKIPAGTMSIGKAGTLFMGNTLCGTR